MSIAIRPTSTNLTAVSLDQFLSDVVRHAGSASEITIDLRGLEFIDLYAMVGIAFCCADLIERRLCHVHLVFDSSGAASFMHRAGFFDILPRDVTISDTFARARSEWVQALRGGNSALLELTPIGSDEAITDVLNRLIRALRYRLRYRKYQAYDFAMLFSELCHNVIDHNPGGASGIAALQVFRGRSGKFMQFVVADRGVGIRTSLNRNPKYSGVASDIDAITTSMKLGASEYEEITRGNGLYHLVRLAANYRGTVHIRSGSGKLYLRLDQQKPQQRAFRVAHLTGTQFAIAFPSRETQTA